MNILFRQPIAFPNALLLVATEDHPDVPDIDCIRTLTPDLPLRVWGDDPRQPETVVIECLDLVEVESP